MQQLIQARLAEAMQKQGIKALVLTDSENFGYVAGPMLPFLKQSPDRAVLALFEAGEKPQCTCWAYPDMAQPIRVQLQKDPAATCVEVAEDNVGISCLVARMTKDKASLSGNVGVDFDAITANDLACLRKNLPACTFVDAGALLRNARMVKLPEEINRIEVACRQVDTGIIGALNHMEGAHSAPTYSRGFYTIGEFIERTRVHAYEGGTCMSGNMAVLAGDGMDSYYMPQIGMLSPDDGLIRMEYGCCHLGYWSVTARMFHIGEDISPADAKACADNIALKKEALALLKPGSTCSDIFKAVKKIADARGIELASDSGMGCGIGRGEMEAPFITPEDGTVLAENMVIALDVKTRGPNDKLVHSMDIYAITADGARLLSWHRNWDKPYLITGYRNAH